jgi:hypothetical protein
MKGSYRVIPYNVKIFAAPENSFNGFRRVAPFALPMSAKQKVCVCRESAANGWQIELALGKAKQTYPLLGTNLKPNPHDSDIVCY